MYIKVPQILASKVYRWRRAVLAFALDTQAVPTYMYWQAVQKAVSSQETFLSWQLRAGVGP